MDVSATELIPVDMLYHHIGIDVGLVNTLDQDQSSFDVYPGHFDEMGRLTMWIQQAIRTGSPRFTLEKNKHGNEVWTGKDAHEMFLVPHTFIQNIHFPSYFEFGPEIKLFLDVVKAIPYVDKSLLRPGFVDARSGKYAAEIYNNVIDVLKQKSAETAYKRIYSNRYASAEKNFQSGQAYVNHLFACHEQLCIVRLDCFIPRREQADGGFNFAHDYLDHFLSNRRTNKLFSKMVGYIWKLEYAEWRGHHFHFILFFADCIWDEVKELSIKIGQHWVNAITKGQGKYVDCTGGRNKYRSSCIGLLAGSDEMSRRELSAAIYFLTKKEQYLRFRLSRDVRLFGRGQIR